MPSMTQQSHPRHDTTDQHEQILLGVDTHKDVHVATVITSTGLLLDTRSFPTPREGYRQLLSWAPAPTEPPSPAICTKKASRSPRSTSPTRPPDADTASPTPSMRQPPRAVLSGRATATATAKTTDGPVEAIRLFKMAKTSAVN